MSRHRQDALVWQAADREARVSGFWREINRRCPDAGIQSDNNRALARAIDIAGVTIGNYKQDPGMMQVKTLSRFVAVLKPDPTVILRLLGYSDKEIKAFREVKP